MQFAHEISPEIIRAHAEMTAAAAVPPPAAPSVADVQDAITKAAGDLGQRLRSLSAAGPAPAPPPPPPPPPPPVRIRIPDRVLDPPPDPQPEPQPESKPEEPEQEPPAEEGSQAAVEDAAGQGTQAMIEEEMNESAEAEGGATEAVSDKPPPYHEMIGDRPPPDKGDLAHSLLDIGPTGGEGGGGREGGEGGGKSLHKDGSWQLVDTEEGEAAEAVGHGGTDRAFYNYISLGVDAWIALEFHKARAADPDAFTSAWRNKMKYGQMSVKARSVTHPEMCSAITLSVDGRTVDIPAGIIGVVVINLPSYAAGSDPWDNNRRPCQSINDGVIEVFGIVSVEQLGLMQMGGNGERLAQGEEVSIEVLQPLACQVDGEPFLLHGACSVGISWSARVNMLSGKKPEHLQGGVGGDPSTPVEPFTPV